jgi:thioredoxin 1
MGIISTTDEKFDEDVMVSDIPVLVDFWAEWCGPCKMIGPILEELAEELEGEINIVKVDVDQSNQIAIKYSIRSIPTLMIIQEGAVKAQHIGAASKAQLQDFIKQNI